MGVVLWMVRSSSPGIGLNCLAEEMYLRKCRSLTDCATVKKKEVVSRWLKKNVVSRWH